MLKPLSFSSCKTLIECKNGLSSDKDNTLAQHLRMWQAWGVKSPTMSKAHIPNVAKILKHT